MSFNILCFPLRYDSPSTGIKRNEFISALAEGACFYQGYVKPLYLQPLYQKDFSLGSYPTAPANKDCYQNYELGTCPVAEKLHFDELVINEHIRLPNDTSDINDLTHAVDKF